MGFYEKNIHYLDLWEYGEKVSNAGFVKVDVRDEECRIWISAKKLYAPDVVIAGIYLLAQGEEQLADQMIMHQGMGTYAAKWESDNLAQTGIAYENWEGIRIEISQQRYIEKMWGKKKKDWLQSMQEIKVKESSPAEKAVKLYEEQSEGPSKRKEPQEAEVQPEKQEEELLTEVKTETGDRLPATKWALINQYYKKKKPFGDEREFLCISPEDLILLPEKYEHLFKNSFLLHGYYAYGHLLLGALDVQQRNMYRLYIPGAGHEKEQIVAGLFGFGNFTPVDQRYGYYYMTVEL